ncbi:MAG: lysylphosphatidylglycerol synthase transmembrane domain-containing protein [Acidimicrobiales bacterium]
MSAAERGGSRRRRVLGFAVSAVVLVLVAPTLASVYGQLGTSVRLPPLWLAAIVVATALQFLSTWTLQRIVLRTDRWLDVAAPELVGNACSHLLPAGSAAGAGVQLRLLTDAGFPLPQALTSLSVTSLLSTAAGLVVLPFIVLAATAAGSHVESRLVAPMWAGAALLAAILAALMFAVGRDRPWRVVAGVVAWVDGRRRRAVDREQLERRLLEERDQVLAAVRERRLLVAVVVIARPLLDYLCLLAALEASGARINPAAALAAFIVSNVAGMIPLTPGGLGFVEAGLAGTITLAGAAGGPARVAVATYRVAATWLPSVAGGCAYLVFRRRHAGRATPVLGDGPDDAVLWSPGVPGGQGGE